MPAFKLEDYLKLETLEDIVSRSAYNPSVNIKKGPPYKVKALYSFKVDGICCGKSDCQKYHNIGFLIVYLAEKETNLCVNCGLQMIDGSYEEHEQKFRSKETLRQQQIKLNTFLEQYDSIKDRVKELKQAPYGANWLFKSLNSFHQAYPKELIAALSELANNSEDNAILDALDNNDDTLSQREQIKHIKGLEIFITDIKEILIGNILQPLKDLELNIEGAEKARSLTRFCTWVDKVEDYFALAETLVDEGRLFFEDENMKLLYNIPLSEKNTKLVKSISWHCDKGPS